MIDSLYEAMAVPATCHLGKRVYKKLFLEHTKLAVADKTALGDDVDTVTWQYTFKPTTIPIHVYEDEMREYPEIALLEVKLKKTGRVHRLAEIIHRAIPYPVIVVFASDEGVSVSLAHKRFSQAEKDAIVAEEFISTGWFDPTDPDGLHADFLDSFNINTWPHTHFFAFYKSAMARVVALECARRTGVFQVDEELGTEDRRELLAHCREGENRMAEFRAKIKKEKQFNRQVELNMEIKELELEFGRSMNGLRG